MDFDHCGEDDDGNGNDDADHDHNDYVKEEYG